MKESDWKIFKKIKERAIDQFCRKALSEFEAIIGDESQDPHERYLYLFKLVDITNRHMALLFDGNSRSKAHLQLMAIRGEGFADINLVSQLSEEFQQQTNPDKVNW